MSKTKINVAAGVLIGVLVGFVFGIGYGSSDTVLKSSGAGKGNVSELSKYRHRDIDADHHNLSEEKAKADTLKFTMVDENGESWSVLMTK